MASISINEELFNVLHQDLCHIKPEYKYKDVILCPICLREISKETVLKSGVEHIVPQGLLKNDINENRDLGTLNQRCGLTVLCREQRVQKGTSKLTQDGCNGLKGKLYDRLWVRHWGKKDIDRDILELRLSVFILIMAYLGAFQVYGYEYILRKELDEIREQFDYPDDQKTSYLDSAKVNLKANGDRIVATSSGHPFALGGLLVNGRPLHIAFRRFKAELPSGHWDVTTVVATISATTPNFKSI